MRQAAEYQRLAVKAMASDLFGCLPKFLYAEVFMEDSVISKIKLQNFCIYIIFTYIKNDLFSSLK